MFFISIILETPFNGHEKELNKLKNIYLNMS